MAYFQIIIPNYNNADYIEKCLLSILEQTFQDYKVLIVDDMSTDNSMETISKFKEESNKIHSIQADKKLFNGGTRNKGIQIVKTLEDSKYIMFIFFNIITFYFFF